MKISRTLKIQLEDGKEIERKEQQTEEDGEEQAREDRGLSKE